MTRATDPTTPAATAVPAAPADASAAPVATPAGIRAAPARMQRDGLFPLWRLSGRITLRTPLHLGSGRDDAITLPDRPGRDAAPGAAPGAAGNTEAHTDRHVAAVARDHRGYPCIPASSFKGALAALARRAGLPQDLQARLFGAEEGDVGGVQAAGAAAASTRAGLVEFVTLYADPTSLPPDSPLPEFATEGHPHVAHLPHVSRNRHSGAAEHQRLYLQSVLPPGVQFQFECTARGAGLTEDDVTTLLGLLALAGDDASPLRLGAGQAADQGRIGWSAAQVQRIDSAAALWAQLTGKAAAPPPAAPAASSASPARPRPGQRVDLAAQAHTHARTQAGTLAGIPATSKAAPPAPTAAPWPTASGLQPHNLWSHPGLAPVQTRLRAAALSLPSGAWLSLPGLQLRFHSPFLVYQANTRKKAGSGEPDGVPRRDHQGRGLLPAHSLHGALRAQAERILRTVGQPAAAGYEVPGVNGLADLAHRLGRDELDLATLLFGAPGWRALLRCSDFADEQGCATPVQHLLAIDRLTGGGKDSAKFAVQVLDCPTLTGQLELDLQRLARVEARCPGSSARALGLLAHVLRDLDDGDIPLGYGASKGWGQSTSDWAARLARALQSGPAHLPHGSGLPTLPEALAAWAATLPPAPDTLQGADLAAAAAQTTPTPPETPALPLPPAGAAEAEPDRFHNPYVFIPFPTPRPDDPHLPWVDADALREGRAAHHSHARYAADALHGELRCRLTTTTPVFIGAGDADAALQKPNTPALKAAYRLGGQLAIPATSLRGLLSSLHESLTASRMRVAGDGIWSVRAAEQEALPLRGVMCRVEGRRADGTRTSYWAIRADDDGRIHPIPRAPLMRLNALADERTEESDRRGGDPLPEVKAPDRSPMARNPDPERLGRKARPVEGQRIFFRLNDQRKVEELAWSAIWRKAVNRPEPQQHQPWPTRESLPQPELLHAPGTPLERLSPSELLFGTVQLRNRRSTGAAPPPASTGAGPAAGSGSATPTGADDPILAWMGKLRFSAALPLTPADQRCAAEVTLKILSSPKPPSPSFYLQPRRGPTRAISKAELAQAPDQFQWRGRKAYLHALRDADRRVRPLDSQGRPDPAGRPPWQTEDPKDAKTALQKVRVTPFAVGNRFEFSLRFANLSREELESLCAALRPAPKFEHKIGIGKPIGLGSVQLEFISLKLSDRHARYRQADFSAASTTLASGESAELAQRLAQAHLSRLQKTDPAVLRALRIIGDPSQVKYPVHYPQEADGSIESENYRWFVTNDKITAAQPKETRQSLETLTATSTGLRGLNRRRRDR